MTLSGHYVFSGTTDAQMRTAAASDFVIVKSTQNTGYVNPKHDAQVQQTRDAGKLVGHFHFSWPPSSDPVAQAKAWIAAAKPKPGDILAQDLEDNAWTAADAKAAPAFLLAVRDVVFDLTGATTWHYTNKSFGKATVDAATPAQRARLFEMPLWLADYSGSVSTLLGWPKWTAWQQSASFDTPEIFNGDAALWRSLGVPEEDPMADPTPAQLKAYGEAAANAIFARRFPKQTIPGDTTSLVDLIVWSEPVINGAAERVIAAFPNSSDPAVIAKAVLDGMDPDLAKKVIDEMKVRL
jgi:hypothetical protein